MKKERNADLVIGAEQLFTLREELVIAGFTREEANGFISQMLMAGITKG